MQQAPPRRYNGDDTQRPFKKKGVSLPRRLAINGGKAGVKAISDWKSDLVTSQVRAYG